MLRAKLELVLEKRLAWVMFIAHLRGYLLNNVGKRRGVMLVVFGAYKGICI